MYGTLMYRSTYTNNSTHTCRQLVWRKEWLFANTAKHGRSSFSLYGANTHTYASLPQTKGSCLLRNWHTRLNRVHVFPLPSLHLPPKRSRASCKTTCVQLACAKNRPADISWDLYRFTQHYFSSWPR